MNSRLTLRTMLHDDEFDKMDEDLDDEVLDEDEEEEDDITEDEDEDTF